MKQARKGRMTALGAAGLMAGLMVAEIAGLQSWAQALAPPFVAKVVGHIAVVIGAYEGGRMVPSRKEEQREIPEQVI